MVNAYANRLPAGNHTAVEWMSTKNVIFIFKSINFQCMVLLCLHVQSLSSVQLFCDPMDCSHGLPFLPPGDLSNPGMDAGSPASLALAGIFFTSTSPGKPIQCYYKDIISYGKLVKYEHRKRASSIKTFCRYWKESFSCLQKYYVNVNEKNSSKKILDAVWLISSHFNKKKKT